MCSIIFDGFQAISSNHMGSPAMIDGAKAVASPGSRSTRSSGEAGYFDVVDSNVPVRPVKIEEMVRPVPRRAWTAVPGSSEESRTKLRVLIVEVGGVYIIHIFH